MAISNIALANSSFTNPTKGSSKPSNPDALYIGIISRIVGNRAIVKIPKLNPVSEFGPCDIYGDMPLVGQQVLCSYIDGRSEHIVILANKYNQATDPSRDEQIKLFMEVSL